MLALASAGPALAEEIDGFAGSVDADDHSSRSYSWALEYRQDFLTYAGASFTYLNEGHLAAHHRDGAALQGWVRSPLWQGLGLSFGAGPYVYFDTQPEASVAGFSDHHSVGEMYTASLSYYWRSTWFVRLNLDAIVAPGNLDTRALMLGFGAKLDGLVSRVDSAPGDSLSDTSEEHPNEIGVFAGQSIINSNSSSRTTNFGIEYRRRVARHVNWSAAWLNEAVGPDGRRDGLSNEAWLVTRLYHRQLAVGIGAGPYLALQHYRTADGRDGSSLQGLASMTVSWQLSHRINLRARWDRVFTQDDQDRDIVSFGIGYGW
jgi:hypothetical protein